MPRTCLDATVPFCSPIKIALSFRFKTEKRLFSQQKRYVVAVASFSKARRLVFPSSTPRLPIEQSSSFFCVNRPFSKAMNPQLHSSRSHYSRFYGMYAGSSRQSALRPSLAWWLSDSLEFSLFFFKNRKPRAIWRCKNLFIYLEVWSLMLHFQHIFFWYKLHRATPCIPSFHYGCTALL